MSYGLVTLGLLIEKPLHGYEIMQAIERRGFAHFMRLSGGGLYYHIQKLVDAGDIELFETTQNEKYPERQVYKITEQGRKSFLQHARVLLSDVEGRRVRDPLDAALCFGAFLDPNEVRAALRYQRDAIQPVYERLELLLALVEASKQDCLVWMKLVLGHSLSRLKAELDWLEKAEKKILKSKGSLRIKNASLAAIQEAEEALRKEQESCHKRTKSVWEVYKTILTEKSTSMHAQKEAKAMYEGYVKKIQTEYKQVLGRVKKETKEKLKHIISPSKERNIP